jgi:hypothetical protein
VRLGLSVAPGYSSAMNAIDPKVASKIASLRRQVEAAQQEFDMAITFHETWKPVAYDKDLHKRMGMSFASNTFFVVRLALRREMLLALMRLWDKNSKTVRMKESVADILRDQSVVNALAADRAARIGMADEEDQMRSDLSQRASEAIALVAKYSEGGSHYAVLEKLRKLRHERLAHLHIEAVAATGLDPTDDEIESFYQDNSKLIGVLLSLVAGVAYDPNDTAGVYRHYASLFWAGVRGERTEGHPNYRAPHLGTPTREKGTRAGLANKQRENSLDRTAILAIDCAAFGMPFVSLRRPRLMR